MNKLFRFVFGFQLLGGAIFFAGLFSSPLSMSVKVFIAAGLMLVWSGIFWLSIEGIATYQFMANAIERLLNEIEQRREEPKFAPEPAARDYLLRAVGKISEKGGDSQLMLILIGVFLFWIIAGWILARYIA